MKFRNLLSMLIVAICGGMIAIFAYTKIFDNDAGAGSANTSSSRPYQLASYGVATIGDVSYPDLTFAAEKAVHCVVHVRVKSMQDTYSSWLDYIQGRRQQVPREGFGSGVILSPDGYIITNNHVIRRSEEIEVRLNDTRVFTAKVIGTDPDTDLALLKIDETNLPHISFGDAEAIRVGEWVLAVGNPLNLTSTVTAGIVSAKARNIGILRTRNQEGIEAFIQTDAAINQCNSGGALVNINGDLIGINTVIISQTAGFTGSAFAVPSSIVQKVYTDLKEYGVVQRAMLGIEFPSPEDNFSSEKEALYVEGVTENFGAAEAGIKIGDVVTAVNDVPVSTFAELQEQISKYRPSDKVKISVIRDKKTQPFMVTLRNIDGGTQIVRDENSEMVLGATFEAVSQRERRDLGIRNGVKVRNVGQDKLRDLGIRNGFIITAVNDKPVNSAKDIQNILDTVKDGERILINGISSRGQVSYFALSK